MNTNNKKLTDILEKLIDGEKGFKQAANNIVDKPRLKNFFHDKALEKSQFISELKTELQTKGINTEIDGSNTASVHRAWMDIKAVISSNNEEAMLTEAANGEKAAVKDYQEILNNQHLDLQTRALLEKQKSTIEKGISKMEFLDHLKT
ncbi:ferritin-like domain-containing protein [Wenyingzhuangia sp. IMCC45467]